MNRKAFLLYLRDLRDLEYARNKIKTIYNQQEYVTNKSIEEMKTPKWAIDSEHVDFGILILGGIVVAAVAAIGFFFKWVTDICSDDILDYLISCCTNIISKACWGLCVILAVVFIISFGENIASARASKKHNDKERARINGNIKTINNLKITWEAQKNYLTREYAKVGNLLNTYYSQNILPMQYRNLSALIYIYQYMATSNANLETVLLHAHMEDGIQRIERRLNDIIRQNEEIIFSQHIAEAHNRKMVEQNKQMLSSLGRIENSASETAYYSKMTANYARTIEYFETARYLQSR